MPQEKGYNGSCYFDRFAQRIDDETRAAAILAERLNSYRPGDWRVSEKCDDERALQRIYDRRAERQASEDAYNQRKLVELQQEKLRLEIARLKKPEAAKTVRKPKKSR